MQQPLTASVLELGPQFPGLAGQGDVGRVVVAEPEDPAGTVRPAVPMADLGPIQQHDIPPSAGKRPGR